MNTAPRETRRSKEQAVTEVLGAWKRNEITYAQGLARLRALGL